jgi:CHASE2 domain-containing sensor protein
MGKLVTLKLDGDFEQGFGVTLEIGLEGARPSTEVTGKLPPATELATHYSNWQSAYRALGISARGIKAKKIIHHGSIEKQKEECCYLAFELCERLNTWLKSDSFLSIREEWLEHLSRSDEVRVLIRTENRNLWQLPWHSWDLLERYPSAEIAFSSPNYKLFPRKRIYYRHKVRILAILGDSEGIEVEKDRQLLENLPDAETTFLVEPQRQELNNQLWEQPWDILFFAGHSQTEGKRGRIYINQTDSLTLEDLRLALREAVRRGLQLAIFNSCEGLGLAYELEQLNIPQVIVMREPVPDQVAQEFLKEFLKRFAGGAPFYLAVQKARENLQALEHKFPCAHWLPVICQNPAHMPPTWHQLVGIDSRRLQFALIVSVVMTILVMGVRQLGMLQAWELQAYDQLLRLRPDEGLDLRLLVVEATEEDINRYGFPLPDATLAQVVEKLEPHQPRVIGLDIFRDRPIGDGHAALASQLQHNDQLIALCSAKEASNPNKPGIKPPPKLPKDRMGFSDVVVDPDGILRRHLLFMQPYHTDPCTIDHSFSVRVALHYLAAEGIKPQTLPGDRVQLGKTVFSPLEVNTGAYQKLDARGFQLMLNYRSSQNLARRVRLAEVLSGQVNPTWVKDRIVLIGVTAPVSNATDYFFTPYSAGEWPYQKMPGVIVQAQMVSQILSAVLDKRPLLWVWNWWGEVLWVWGWSMVGGLIAWGIPRRLYLVLAASTAIGILYGICFVLLTQGGWVPLVPSALALLATGGSVVAYTVHQKRQQQEVLGRNEREKVTFTADSN